MPDPGRSFHSVLFEEAGDAARAEHRQQPSCFPDLNLDQALDSMTAGRGEYQLKPFFYTPLPDPGAVAYRRPADGLAYAAAIAAKYGLTYQRVKERVS